MVLVLRGVAENTRAVAPARGRWWPWLPIASAIVVFASSISERASWFDESVTVFMSGLSMSELVDAVAVQDAVHGLYYYLVGAWADVVGHGLWQSRSLSVLAVVAAVAGTVGILWWAGRPKAAVIAGFAMVLLPSVDRFATEARSYALVMALAVIAGLLLMRAMERPTAGIWVFYAGVMVLMGYLFVYSLLLLPAHAVTLRIASSRRAVWRGFLPASSIVVIAVLPLLYFAVQQRYQISWIPPTRAGSWSRIATTWTDLPILPAALLLTSIIAVVVMVALLRNRRDVVVALALPWLVLPIGFLVMASVVVPVFVGRYVLFSAPALAILIGVGLASIRPQWLAAATGGVLAVLAISGATIAPAEDGFDDWASKRGYLEAVADDGDIAVFAPHEYSLIAGTDPGFSLDLVVENEEVFPIPQSELIDARVVERIEGDRVWLVRKKELAPEMEDRFRSIMERSGLTLVGSEWVGNAEIDQYRRLG